METIADRLKLTVNEFLLKLYTVNVDWEPKPATDRWSAKEVIGHLLDSANINLHRFVRCTYEQNFKLVYAQNEWVAVQHYQDARVDDLLTMWRLVNNQIARVLENYPPGAWQNKCDNGRSEVSLHTIEFIANDYVDHMQHHLAQII